MDEDFNLEVDEGTRYEYLKKSLKSKDIYYFLDKEQNIDILSKEIFKKEKRDNSLPL